MPPSYKLMDILWAHTGTIGCIVLKEKLAPTLDNLHGLYQASKCLFAEDQLNLLAAVEWASWGSWSGCSQTCQGGTRFRRRNCQNGNVCNGTSIDVEFCNHDVPCTGISKLWTDKLCEGNCSGFNGAIILLMSSSSVLQSNRVPQSRLSTIYGDLFVLKVLLLRSIPVGFKGYILYIMFSITGDFNKGTSPR